MVFGKPKVTVMLAILTALFISFFVSLSSDPSQNLLRRAILSAAIVDLLLIWLSIMGLLLLEFYRHVYQIPKKVQMQAVEPAMEL